MGLRKNPLKQLFVQQLFVELLGLIEQPTTDLILCDGATVGPLEKLNQTASK